MLERKGLRLSVSTVGRILSRAIVIRAVPRASAPGTAQAEAPPQVQRLGATLEVRPRPERSGRFGAHRPHDLLPRRPNRQGGSGGLFESAPSAPPRLPLQRRHFHRPHARTLPAPAAGAPPTPPGRPTPCAKCSPRPSDPTLPKDGGVCRAAPTPTRSQPRQRQTVLLQQLLRRERRPEVRWRSRTRRTASSRTSARNALFDGAPTPSRPPLVPGTVSSDASPASRSAPDDPPPCAASRTFSTTAAINAARSASLTVIVPSSSKSRLHATAKRQHSKSKRGHFCFALTCANKELDTFAEHCDS